MPDTEERENELINVIEDVKYQEIVGFGGAFTEAAAHTLHKLPKEKQTEIIDSYFNPVTGNGYSLCRTHINSCDFSLGNYACVEVDGDTELKSFNINREMIDIIPMINAAQGASVEGFGLLLSPWSPPAWMKDTKQMNCGGKLLPQYAQAWADCYTKFVLAFKEQGIDINYISVQNEAKAVQTWDSCVYTAFEEKEFVIKNLAPSLKAAGLGDIKILVWDHNKERVFDRAKETFNDPEANQVVDGIAFHWYSGDHFEVLDAVHKMWPDKLLMFTEGCVEVNSNIGDWTSGEKYAHEIIGDLNHGACGYID